MNEIRAVVRRTEQGGAWVETGPAVSCSRCQGGGGCASVSISRLFCSPARQFRVDSDIELTAGDKVVLGMPDDQVLRAALLGYGLPVVGLLLGAVAGDAVPVAGGAGEWPSLAGGAVGFVLGLWLARRRSVSIGQPRLLRRVDACESAAVVMHPPPGST